jgi:hypothetical protein
MNRQDDVEPYYYDEDDGLSCWKSCPAITLKGGCLVQTIFPSVLESVFQGTPPINAHYAQETVLKIRERYVNHRSVIARTDC